MTRLLSLVLIQGLVLMSSAAAMAQENKRPAARPPEPAAGVQNAKRDETTPQPTPPPPAVRERRGSRPGDKPFVLQLKSSECTEVAHLVEEAFADCTASPVLRTNSIVFVGPEELLPRVREFLAQLDAPVSEGDELELTMIPVQQRRVDEIADAVSSLLAGRYSGDYLRIAKDRGRSALVLRGTKAAAEKVRNFVQQLDRPPSSVSLEFAFFRGNASRADGSVDVPADLASVAEELKKFGSVELAGRLTTVAVENDKFSIEGAITETMPRLRVYGDVVSANADGTVKLKLMAELSLEQRAQRGAATEAKGQPTSRPARGAEFELETSVQTKRGDYVVLGSAPAGGAPGESVILVLHVRE